MFVWGQRDDEGMIQLHPGPSSDRKMLLLAEEVSRCWALMSWGFLLRKKCMTFFRSFGNDSQLCSSQRHRTCKRKWTRWGAAAKKNIRDSIDIGTLTAFTVDSPHVWLGKSYFLFVPCVLGGCDCNWDSGSDCVSSIFKLFLSPWWSRNSWL